jgi:type I restriction enzyme S subunit
MNFKVYKLKELVENFSVRARDYGGSDGLEFLGVSNDDGIVKSKSAAEHKGEEYKIIEKGCFAYNPYRINIGSIAYHNEDIKGLISPAYVVFKTKQNSIKDNLLFKFLKSYEGQRQIKFHGRGTVRQALRFEDLCKIEISIPSYENQEKLIFDIEKSEIESKRFSNELSHQLDLIKQLRQAFLREAMQGQSLKCTNTTETGQQLLTKIKAEKAKLVAEKRLKKEKELPPISDDEIPFEIPKNWAWCRLGEVTLQIFDGPFGSHLKTADYTNSGIQVIRLGNLGEMSFKQEKETFISELKYQTIKQHTVFKGDLIIGSFLADGVKCTILPELKHITIAKADCFTVRVNKERISNKYLMYLLSSNIMFTELSKLLRGMTRLRINTTQLKELVIPLPSLYDQEQIVAKLEELMSFCDDLEKSIKETQDYNGMLLQQVLKEALQPQKNVKTISAENRKIENPLKTVLAGHIINLNNTTDFGRVKFQKLLFLTEYICKIDFDSNYIKKVAGPYDDVLIKSIESDFTRMRFFNVVQDKTDNKRVRYTALAGANELESLFLENFTDESLRINNTLLKFRPLSWGECELIATLYAVWNNRIIKNELITDELLYSDFMAWDKQKSKYHSVFHKWLFWMKDERIIPDGWGKYIDMPQ